MTRLSPLPRSAQGQQDARRGKIAAIHVAQQQLGLDESTYRDLLQRVSGEHGAAQRSSAVMTTKQLRAVLDEMRRLGAARPTPAGKPAPGMYPGRPHNADAKAMPEMITKVEALLTDMKLPWAYADAIAQRQHGVARVAWVRKPEQLRAIIAALHVEQEKRALNAAVDAQLQRLGWAADRVVVMLAPLRANWRRHRPSLSLVLDYLRDQVA